MGAKIARVSKDNFEESDIQSLLEGGRLLRDGGTVIFPTETVYGLGANALSPDAAAKIYKAKGRPSDNPLIVHISRLDMLQEIAKDVSEDAKLLMERFWPGPLTLIFNKKDIVPKETTAGLDTVAVRMPSHKVALELIEIAGVPIAAPSANISGRPSITSSKYALEEMSDRVDMIILSDDCDIGIESTVVDMTGSIPLVLRPGKISQREIFEAVAGNDADRLSSMKSALEEIMAAKKAGEGKATDRETSIKDPDEGSADLENIFDMENHAPKSPGMKYRHYSPRAKVIVVAQLEKVRSVLSEQLDMKDEAGNKLYQREEIKVFCLDDRAPVYGENAHSLGHDSLDLAKNIFTSLREMDDRGVKVIICECFEGDELASAVMNRLIKASSNI